MHCDLVISLELSKLAELQYCDLWKLSLVLPRVLYFCCTGCVGALAQPLVTRSLFMSASKEPRKTGSELEQGNLSRI